MSFETSVSGIKAAATDLSVVGNNVANSSTTGFKSAKAEFGDLYASSLLGTVAQGGGQGVALQAINTNFSQGSIDFTSNELDLAINGNGFFQLSDNGEALYTRAGAFTVDKGGYIVSQAGHRLQGLPLDGEGAITGALGDIKLSTQLVAPQGTKSAEIVANLDSREVPPETVWTGNFNAFATPPTQPDASMYNSSTSMTVFDDLGNPHVMSISFVKGTNNAWEARTLIDGVETGAATALPFSADGKFAAADLPLKINITDWQPLDSTGASNGAPLQSFTVDLSDSTQYGAVFGTSSIVQDGYTAGQMRGVEVDESGVVFARYTNGQSQSLGQVILANFNNPHGLANAGSTNFVESYASGSPIQAAAGSGGTGVIQSGALEGSNVELTEQLVRMIVAQRNFQANAQMIQTEDAVTQTVINLR